jgi:hypothetical protein
MNEKVEHLDVWESYASNNEWGTNPFVVGYASTEKDALILSRGAGFYGADGGARKKAAVRIGNSVFLIQGPIDLDGKVAQEKEKVRKNALSKLSPDEISLLGIKP